MIQLILIGALLVGAATAAGGAVWAFNKNAVDACHSKWQADLAKANLQIEQANKEKADAVQRAQSQAFADMSKIETDLAETKRLLAEALFHIPLSEVCNACDIPESHIWGLRADERRPASSSIPANPGPASGPGTASPGSKTSLPSKETGKDVQGKRTPRRKSVRGGSEKTN